MLDRSLVHEVLQAARRRGGSFAEVFVEETTNTTIRLDDGKVEELTTGLDRGAGVRVAHGTSYGYAYSNRLDRDALLEAAEAASAALRDGEGGDVVDLRTLEGPDTNRVQRAAASVPAADKVAWLRELDDVARSFSPEVIQVVGVYGDSLAAAVDRRLRWPLGRRGAAPDPPGRTGGGQARRQHPDRVPRTGGVCRRRVRGRTHAGGHRHRGGQARRDDARLDPRAGRRDDRGARARHGRRPVPRGGRPSARVRRHRQRGQRVRGLGGPTVRQRTPQRRGRRHDPQRLGFVHVRRRRRAGTEHGAVHRRRAAGVPLRPAASRQGGRDVHRERPTPVLRLPSRAAHDQHEHPQRFLQARRHPRRHRAAACG